MPYAVLKSSNTAEPLFLGVLVKQKRIIVKIQNWLVVTVILRESTQKFRNWPENNARTARCTTKNKDIIIWRSKWKHTRASEGYKEDCKNTKFTELTETEVQCMDGSADRGKLVLFVCRMLSPILGLCRRELGRGRQVWPGGLKQHVHNKSHRAHCECWEPNTLPWL